MTKILIVDDDKDSLKLISTMLQRQGYETKAIALGRQAVDEAMTHKPDLIILDVMMPDVDGYTVCRTLRQNPRTATIPIMMFSAKSRPEEKVKGLENGADAYITKPIHPAELAAQVAAILARTKVSSLDIPERVGRSIGFTGAKGGAGTSTTALNVAQALQRKNLSTIIADYNVLSPSLSLMLGMNQYDALDDLIEKPLETLTPPAIREYLTQHESGLRVLPSTGHTLYNRDYYEKKLHRLTDSLVRNAAFTIIDLGLGESQLVLDSVRQLDMIVLVTESNRLALAKTREFIEKLKRINYIPANFMIVTVARVQTSLQISWSDAEKMINHKISAFIPAQAENAFQATEERTTIVQLRPEAMGTRQYMSLADSIVNQFRPKSAG